MHVTCNQLGDRPPLVRCALPKSVPDYHVDKQMADENAISVVASSLVDRLSQKYTHLYRVVLGYPSRLKEDELQCW